MMMQWNYPTSILFGPGQIQQLSLMCDELHIKAPLIVCDKFIETLDWFSDITLTQAVIFNEFEANPDDLQVALGVILYKEKACDGVIAIGGGSALDTGKTIAFMVGQNKPLWDFIDENDNYLRASDAGIAPIIAIPTTAGTGADVGRAAVIVNSKTRAKHLIFHPKMLATRVINDPCLTLSVPPQLTAATGMDALAHCLEAFCVPSFHPMADGIALEGMRLIHLSLLKAYKEGHDLKARTNLMAAASMGGAAFQKGLGLIHALSHPVGGLYDVHHGLLNAIFMPYVLVFNREYIEQKCCLLARFLDLSTHDFEGVLHWIIDLSECLGLPNNLADLGIDESFVDELAALAMRDPSAMGNPRALTTTNCREVLLRAIRGNL